MLIIYYLSAAAAPTEGAVACHYPLCGHGSRLNHGTVTATAFMPAASDAQQAA
jgi:hypothetical protein